MVRVPVWLRGGAMLAGTAVAWGGMFAVTKPLMGVVDPFTLTLLRYGVTAPVFLATKFEAFADRGKHDYLFSHDLGDLISVIDGRDELLAECARLDDELKGYLRDRVGRLLATPAFLEALPGHLPGDAASQARLPDLEDKLRLLAKLG